MKHLENIRTVSMLALFVTMLAFCACEQFTRSTKSDEITEVVDSSLVDDSMSITEWVKWQNDLRIEKYNDSVFLAMPEPILTFILVQCGTQLDVEEIVTEYLAHKRFYDETVLKAMETQKSIIPDSLPKIPIANTPIASSDSLKASI
jgi:hypothetical protein